MTDVVTPGAPRTAVFAGYLGLVMAVGPLLHYSFSALGPMVVDDLALSATEFGMLWFVTFGAAALFTLVGGRLSDRCDARGLFLVVFVLAGLGILVAGAAQGLVWIFVALALSGAAQSFSNPTTNAVVATTVAASERGFVLGLKQSGVQLAQVFAGLAMPPLALLVGWRNALLVSAVIALSGVVLTIRLVPARPLLHRPSGKRQSSSGRRSMSPVVAWMTIYALLMGAVTQATNVYLPLYAHQELHLSLTTVGVLTAFLGGFGVAARLLWGRASDRTASLAWPLLGLAGLTSTAMITFWAADQVGAWSVWVGAALFSFGALAANVLLMAAVVRYVVQDTVGRATGWVSLGLYAGFMVGPVATGAVVDARGFDWAWGAVLAVSLVLMGLALRIKVDDHLPRGDRVLTPRTVRIRSARSRLPRHWTTPS